MKILIYGSGVVGKAVGFGFEKLRHEVTFHDKDGKVLLDLEIKGHKIIKKFEEYDICFMCIPEIHISKCIREMNTELAKLIVIKSTVPVGTTDLLNRKFPKHRPIVHNPEFLREKFALEDFLAPPFIIIGFSEGHLKEKMLKSLYYTYDSFNVPIFVIPAKESEFIKLTMNAYLATQISFWNEIYKIGQAYDFDTNQLVKKILRHEPRISKYGNSFHGKPYEGRCLPKDIEQFIQVAYKKKIIAKLLQAVQSTNEELKHENINVK